MRGDTVRVNLYSISIEIFHNSKGERVNEANPANTRHSHNAVSMLAHRLRRWPNIETALGECPVFAGKLSGVLRVLLLRVVILV